MIGVFPVRADWNIHLPWTALIEYNLMASSNTSSELSKAPTSLKNPFSIAARSTISSITSKYTRDARVQWSIVSPKSSKYSQKQTPSPTVILPPAGEPSDTVIIPISVPERSNTIGAMDEQREPSEDSTSDSPSLQTTGQGSNVSQPTGTSFRKQRAKTSHVHEHISTRGEDFVCNRCSKVYKSSGGTGAISRHLKRAHSIDSTASGIAKRRIREIIAVDAAINREAEIHDKAEGKRREQLMGIGLNKTTLKCLYLQWVITQDVPSKQVRNTAFRNFLEYVNPVANRMLSDFESTVAGIEATFAENDA